MKQLLSTIKTFLFQDVKRENEVKDTAILLRLLTLLSFLYYPILFIIMHKFLTLHGIVLMILVFCSMIIIFAASYHDKTAVCLYSYCSITALSACMFTFFKGTDAGFQYIALLCIFVIFFRTEGSLLYKYIYTVLSSLLICLVSLLAVSAKPLFQRNSQIYCFLLMHNLLYAILMTFIISRFFCLKFSASEHKILQYSKKLEQLASIDALTGLQNRRSMMTHLEKLAKSYEHSEMPFSIVIADIDHFKSVNDTYGHDTGDYVLKKLAEVFREFMTDRGHVSRWGGEEFLFTFEGNNADYIFVELNELKTRVKNTDFFFNEQHLNITMTFGLEEFDSGAGLLEVITKADQKLYIGKEQGRNRVIY